MYVTPRYWPTWLGFGIFWLLSRLPVNTQLGIGRGLGSLLYYLVPARRRVVETNIRLALPEFDASQQSELTKASYRHIGMAIAETGLLWFRSPDTLAGRVQFAGAEHLDAALASKRGVILLQAHFTTIDLCGCFVGARWPVSAVYDNPKNALYAHMLKQQRSKHLSALIDNRDIRSMVRRLRRGEIVWYSPDQTVHPRKGGIATRYFGNPVLTTSGTARIITMTGATIVPFIPTRDANGDTYTLTFRPAVDIDSSDVEAATQAVNDLLEAQVREQPEQYLWAHKRFKPPAGFPNPYT